MAGDYFDTAYQGAYKSGLSLGQGIGSAAGDVAGGLAAKNKRKEAKKMLEQFGVMRPKDATYEDYDKVIKESGGGINVIGTPEEKLNAAKKMFDFMKIPHPKTPMEFDAKRAAELGMDYDATDGSLKFKPSKSMLSQFGLDALEDEELKTRLAAAGMKMDGLDQKGNPRVREIKEDKLPASVQSLKIKTLADVKNTIETNKVQRDRIEEAKKAIDKIPSGRVGKISMIATRNFDPDNPVLGEWQKVKQVLTDDTLLNTARTKGAISDQEMELFKESAANNDLMAKPALRVVFDKLTKFINAEEKAKVDAYNESFGDEINKEDNSEEDFSTMSDDELRRIAGGK